MATEDVLLRIGFEKIYIFRHHRSSVSNEQKRKKRGYAKALNKFNQK